MIELPEDVLSFWFADDVHSPEGVAACCRRWFESDPAFDERVRGRFGELPARALRGELHAWRAEPRSTLALVLTLDQLPRNLYRGTAACFAYDAAALDLAVFALEREDDFELAPLEAMFLYLPFEHTEDPAAQDRSVSLFRGLVDRASPPLRPQFESFLEYAVRHCEVIERFGRFPHRNATLGRESTDDERAYLEAGGETFGGAVAPG